MNKNKIDIIGLVNKRLNNIGVNEGNIFVDKNGSLDFVIVTKTDPEKEAAIFGEQIEISKEINQNINFQVFPSDSLVAHLLKEFEPIGGIGAIK